MSEAPKRADWPIVAALTVLGLLLVPLALYVGGYFLLSENRVLPNGKSIRVFDAEWKARAYQPMAKVESLVSGKKVLLSHYSDGRSIPSLKPSQ